MADAPDPARPPEPSGGLARGLERRALALLVLLALLVGLSVAYVMVARGVFEATQRLVLLADDSEGVQVGMDLTFSGFPIGRVRRIELAPDGSVRILIDVPTRDAHWLRTSSVFTLSRGLVGGTAIRAYSGILADPPLPDGAERKVLAGDATAEIPRIMSEVRALVANLTALTASDSALAGTLSAVQKATTTLESRLAAKRGVAEMLLGDDAPRLGVVLGRTDALLKRLDGLVQRTDGLVLRTDGVIARADQKLLGEQGLAVDAQGAVKQLQALLAEARGSLARVDGVLKEAEGVAKNARVASADLGVLRAEVEASLRKVEALVDEVNRRWPLKRDTEIRLP